MDQFAAEWDAQELCIRYVSGPRNQKIPSFQQFPRTPQPSELTIVAEDVKRLAQEAGVKGARIHVERAIAADYEQVLREVTACLSSAKARAA